MRKCLAAFTTPIVSYPSFLNFTQEDAETVTVNVRSPASLDGRCGQQAMISMHISIFREMLANALKELT
jgi:hypothetical protein